MRPLHRGLRRVLLVGVLVLALTGAMVVPAGSAAAQPQAEAAGDCVEPVLIGAYWGMRICQYLPTRITYRNRYHWFVVGSNHQIYYIWQRYPGDTVYSGWHSLGGYGLSMVHSYYHGSGFRIEVTGYNIRIHERMKYCKVYAPANGWSPWYGC